MRIQSNPRAAIRRKSPTTIRWAKVPQTWQRRSSLRSSAREFAPVSCACHENRCTDRKPFRRKLPFVSQKIGASPHRKNPVLQTHHPPSELWMCVKIYILSSHHGAQLCQQPFRPQSETGKTERIGCYRNHSLGMTLLVLSAASRVLIVKKPPALCLGPRPSLRYASCDCALC